MHSDERRKAIADVLRAADAPISASALAEKFSVSFSSACKYPSISERHCSREVYSIQ